MARVFNAVAAMGICASLAMLGWELQTDRPNVTRYNFSVVMPPPSDSDEDDTDAPPAHHDFQGQDQHSGDQDDDNGDNDDHSGHPIGHNDPDAPIPT